jgi:hypothetical protein
MSATILDTLSVNKTGNLIRMAFGAVMGVIVTAGLFWLDRKSVV